MNFSEIFNVLQNSDETDRIEAKSASHGIGKSFLETVSAFCNEPGLGGGYILLGVSEDQGEHDRKFTITGVRDADQLQKQISSQCRELFNTPIRPIIKVDTHGAKKVLLVFVDEANRHDKPIFIKKRGIEKGSYRRIGSSDQLCTWDDLSLLYQLRSEQSYDETLIQDASFADLDPAAIKLFRYERQKVKPNARELLYNDEDLLKAIRVLRTEKGSTYPTVGGILLFGDEMALKRLFPMRNHIDYMLIEGREWITDSEHRYTAVEMCESLITGVPRLINQIMNDIPQVFALEEDEIRRKDNPMIPRRVIREAVVNAVMHKDYRVSYPTQIIKYANRIEFRNAGYSLKPQEEIGLPGSAQRNELLAEVFRDINYAEAKGTGIGTMRDEMKKANLSVPLIESSRSSNLFVLTLLPHHLFGKKDIEWLDHFKHYDLTDDEARILIVAREKGAISNEEYRAITAVDTLTASSHLRRLRDHGLLEQRGGGNKTFYVPTNRLLTPSVTSLSGELTPHITSLSGELTPHIARLPENFPSMSTVLKEKIEKLKKRGAPKKMKAVIKELCSIQPLNLSDLSAILSRHPKYIREHYLNEMMSAKELVYTFPDQPNHPGQAYTIPNPEED